MLIFAVFLVLRDGMRASLATLLVANLVLLHKLRAFFFCSTSTTKVSALVPSSSIRYIFWSIEHENCLNFGTKGFLTMPWQRFCTLDGPFNEQKKLKKWNPFGKIIHWFFYNFICKTWHTEIMDSNRLPFCILILSSYFFLYLIFNIPIFSFPQLS
jgi:hypothetical protein